MADRHKEPRDRELAPLTVLLDDDAGELVAAQQLRNGGAEHEFHVFALFKRLDELLLAAEGVAPVDQIDPAAFLAQQQRVLQGAVAAAVDGHVLARVEGPVAHSAEAHAVSDQLRLAFKTEHPGLRADGGDERAALEDRAGVAGDGLDPVGPDRNHGDLVELDLRALLHGLFQQPVAELCAADGHEAGEVFNLGAPGDLAAEGVLLDHEHGFARAPGVGGGGQARGPSADDEDIVKHDDSPFDDDKCPDDPGICRMNRFFTVSCSGSP